MHLPRLVANAVNGAPGLGCGRPFDNDMSNYLKRQMLQRPCQGTLVSAHRRPGILPNGGNEFCPVVATKGSVQTTV